MRVCGECAWWDPNNDKESGDCCAPAPMSFWDLWDRRTMNADADATACPCFKARVVAECLECGGTGMRQLGNEWTDEHCPACRKEGR